MMLDRGWPGQRVVPAARVTSASPVCAVLETNPSGKSRIRSVAYMNSKSGKITAFFCVNLLAAYVPAVVCVMDLPKVSPALVFLTSPVALAGIATS